MGVYWVFTGVACALNLFITAILTTLAYVKDLRSELVNLDAIDKSEKSSMEIRKRIARFIMLHMHAKQLSVTNVIVIAMKCHVIAVELQMCF